MVSPGIEGSAQEAVNALGNRGTGWASIVLRARVEGGFTLAESDFDSDRARKDVRERDSSNAMDHFALVVPCTFFCLVIEVGFRAAHLQRGEIKGTPTRTS